MGKQYTKVTNEQRKELIKLIYEQNHSISSAAEMTGIYYPTAKAINKVFKKEKRVQKRNFRYRAKKEDQFIGIIRNKIPVERLQTQNIDSLQVQRITCGISLKLKNENLQTLKQQIDNSKGTSCQQTDTNSEKSHDLQLTTSQLLLNKLQEANRDTTVKQVLPFESALENIVQPVNSGYLAQSQNPIQITKEYLSLLQLIFHQLMVRKYIQINDEQRRQFLRLVHQEGFSISKASKLASIPYDNAKVINRIYQREQRVNKINFRHRHRPQKCFENDERYIQYIKESQLIHECCQLENLEFCNCDQKVYGILIIKITITCSTNRSRQIITVTIMKFGRTLICRRNLMISKNTLRLSQIQPTSLEQLIIQGSKGVSGLKSPRMYQRKTKA
ncbi:UNKNOWN [Stylonychia lemnae]|uniref:Uncharacterized protein n=1 Tax=Stylonychia lemnae TaxID=5949 RepID=A0A078AGS5_STYLE|nr:UNKNOWN [Stylonychia lemnae]|eukprot:CDW80058.1 UNKNOWN [Stylonychia lemnae]